MTTPQEIKVTLTLPVIAINTILAGLDELQGKFSRELHAEILKQAIPQVPVTPETLGDTEA